MWAFKVKLQLSVVSKHFLFSVVFVVTHGFTDMELVCSVQEYAWGKQGSSSQVARYVPQLNRFVHMVASLNDK